MWTKKQFTDAVGVGLNAGDYWVFVESNSQQDPVLQSQDIQGAFLNAAAVLTNGNMGCFVAFGTHSQKAAVGFSNKMQARADVVAVDGPNIK